MQFRYYTTEKAIKNINKPTFLQCMTAQTVLTIVLDAMGRDTLQRYLLATTRERLFPNLEALGLGNIIDISFHAVIAPVEADVALAAEPSSTWADSVMGHRELMLLCQHWKMCRRHEHRNMV